MFGMNMLNDHVMKTSIVPMFSIVGQCLENGFFFFANPENRSLTNDPPVTILCLVNCVNVQIVVEFTMVKKCDESLNRSIFVENQVSYRIYFPLHDQDNPN